MTTCSSPAHGTSGARVDRSAPRVREDGAVDVDQEFGDRYRVTGGDVFIEIERAVLGTDYQATGYTTRREADELARVLDLRPGTRLLDLGSGCGWPGLYLATATGCEVVTVDPVVAGAEASASRADRDGLRPRHLAVVGRGELLPLRPCSFDAVVHVDVTC